MLISQLVNSMYYLLHWRILCLVHVVEWEWPLRKFINYLLKDVSCWSQVMDPCLPFLNFIAYTCYSFFYMYLVHKRHLGWFVEKPNE